MAGVGLGVHGRERACLRGVPVRRAARLRPRRLASGERQRAGSPASRLGAADLAITTVFLGAVASIAILTARLATRRTAA
jgi:hypothetical protein